VKKVDEKKPKIKEDKARGPEHLSKQGGGGTEGDVPAVGTRKNKTVIFAQGKRAGKRGNIKKEGKRRKNAPSEGQLF